MRRKVDVILFSGQPILATISYYILASSLLWFRRRRTRVCACTCTCIATLHLQAVCTCTLVPAFVRTDGRLVAGSDVRTHNVLAKFNPI